MGATKLEQKVYREIMRRLEAGTQDDLAAANSILTSALELLDTTPVTEPATVEFGYLDRSYKEHPGMVRTYANGVHQGWLHATRYTDDIDAALRLGQKLLGDTHRIEIVLDRNGARARALNIALGTNDRWHWANESRHEPWAARAVLHAVLHAYRLNIEAENHG